MRLLTGYLIFPSRQRRDQAQTRLASEIVTRGFTDHTYDFGSPTGIATGLVSRTLEGQSGLLLAVAGPDAAIAQAQADLEVYLKGQWGEGCYFGSEWLS